MPPKKTMGINKIQKIKKQVKKEANDGRIVPLRVIILNIGRKMPVTTAASTRMDKNGHNSQPSKNMEIKKQARKNSKIILPAVFSIIRPPQCIMEYDLRSGYRAKKSFESGVSGPENPAFHSIHVAAVTAFLNRCDFFGTFQIEPKAISDAYDNKHIITTRQLAGALSAYITTS